jgi:acetoin utilization deacetylase AcuC-like enzyme
MQLAPPLPRFPRLDALVRRALRETPLRESALAQRNVHRAMRRLGHSVLPTWYHHTYRLPLPGFEANIGAELRRSDFALWYLHDAELVPPQHVREPERISYRDLERVHAPAWLDRMHSPDAIARVYAATATDASASAVVFSVRLACGGTLAAAREALARRRPTLNLGGGFHHAEPDKGGGYCLLNDIAVAIAVLRHEGFDGQVCVIDLDAHPPDGTAACLKDDPKAWIGSISGADWGALPGNVDETYLPGADDETYLRALDALLRRMPEPQLAFVLAGGDVLAEDHHGGLRLTVEGTRRRDERVEARLRGVGSVWLPAGGYHKESWRVLANTALVLAHSPVPQVPSSYDPLDRRYSWIAGTLHNEDLGGSADIDLADLAADLHLAPRRPRLLDYYTPEGLEIALDRYGMLDQMRRLGYRDFRVEIEPEGIGDRARVFGRCGGEEHLLVETVLEKKRIGEETVLYIHWLTLRHPMAPLDDDQPGLPGQEVQGLGLSREFSALFARMVERLHFAGVAWTPSHYHMAYGSRHVARFVSPERQGRFEAMLRDLGGIPVAEVTRAVAEGRVRCNGAPYRWEAEDMVAWVEPRPSDEETARREAERCSFAIAAGDDPDDQPAYDPPPRSIPPTDT